MSDLRLGTRGSPLARVQCADAVRRVAAALGRDAVEVIVSTSGDRIQDRPLREAGGKGLFVKELDEALRAGTVDVAVHSLKDVPSELADDIVLAAVFERASPADVLVTRGPRRIDELPAGARVGTTSLRRQSQVLLANGGVEIGMLRGNVGTRLARLAAGDFEAILLARAGMDRLGVELGEAVATELDPWSFVAAAGQGAVALAVRAGDRDLRRDLAVLDHAPTRAAVEAERAFARVFGGGCHLPLGAHARFTAQGELELVGLVAAPDGSRSVRDQTRGRADQAEAMGQGLARRLLDAGAQGILDSVQAPV